MKRIFTYITLFILFAFTTVFADGFKEIKSTYFYDKEYVISYEDITPAISDSCYFGIVDYNSSGTWIQISEKFSWKATETKSIIYKIPFKSDSIDIGIFTNENGIWSLHDSYNTKFSYSTNAIFNNLYDTLFTDGKFCMEIFAIPDELPSQLLLQYLTDNGVWFNLETISVSNIINYEFENKILYSTKFRIVYVDTSFCLDESNFIPFSPYIPHFEFKTYGGNKNINDNVIIEWEKSWDFNKTLLEIFIDDNLISSIFYNTDNINLNFTEFGNYKIVGTVENQYFKIEKTLLFFIINPNDTLILENEKLKKEIIFKDSIINELNLTINELISSKDTLILDNEKFKKEIIFKDSIINELNLTIDELINSKDTLILIKNIITDVIEYQISSKSLPIINITNNKIEINSLGKDVSYYIYNIIGQNFKSERFTNGINEIDVSYLNPDIYFIYLIIDNQTIFYKFLKF